MLLTLSKSLDRSMSDAPKTAFCIIDADILTYEDHIQSQHPSPQIITLVHAHKSIMLINVKMPTVVGILTFISRINTKCESL